MGLVSAAEHEKRLAKTRAKQSGKSIRVSAAEHEKRLAKTRATQRRNGQSSVNASYTQEQQLRNQLSQSIGKDLANTIKVDKLAEVTQQYSSQEQERQRQELSNLLKASVVRNIETKQQAQQLNRAINKAVKSEQNRLKPESKTSGVFGVGKEPSLSQKIRQDLTPAKDRTKESGFIRGLKGLGEYFIGGFQDVVTGAGVLGSAIVGSKTAAIQVKNFVKSISPSKIGTALGKQVQSTDPYMKTQGLLTVGSLFIGFRTPTVKTKVNTSTSNWTFKQSSKNKSNIKIETKGTLKNGDSFTQVTKITQSGKDLTGSTIITSKGKSTRQRINLKDEGGFYIDKSTGKRIDKEFNSPEKINYEITKVKVSKLKKKDRDVYSDGKLLTVGQKLVRIKKTKGEIRKGKKTEITKTKESLIDFAKDKKGKPIDVKAIKQLFTVKASKKKTKKQLELDNKKLKQFLKAIDYDKTIVQGLDRRTRLARVLGLSKSSSTFKKIEKGIKDGLEWIETTKVKIKATGVKKKTQPKKRTVAQSLGKKGQLLGQNLPTKPLSKTKKQQLLSIPKTISIPKLKTRIKVLRAYKGRGFLPTRATTQTITRIQTKIRKIETGKIKTPSKKDKTIKDTSQKRITGQKRTPKTKTNSIKKTETKRIIKPNKLITPKLLRKPKRVPKPKFDISIDSKKLENKILTFKGVYRERKYKNKPAGKNNPIITKSITIRDTKNRALKRVSKKVDTSLARSLDLKVVSIGKYKKDITKPIRLKKFNLKKAKKSPSLKLIEKSKANFDTKGEKREAKVQKLRKYKSKRV